MSFALKRDEIAHALSGVADVHGFTKRPSIPNVGDAWPTQGGGVRAAGDEFLITWYVRVLCPQDDIAASEWWDQHWPPLFYALKPVGYVTGFDPIQLDTEAGLQLAYQITMTAEE